MLLYNLFITCTNFVYVIAYTNNLFTIKKFQYNVNDAHCGVTSTTTFDYKNMLIYRNELQPQTPATTSDNIIMLNATYMTADYNVIPSMGKDPIKSFQKMIDRFLFGRKVDVSFEVQKLNAIENTDLYAHFPQGNIMSAELFRNKTSVHLPMAEFVHQGHCYLRVSKDYMQTAVDAFAIFLHGSVEDILHLPSEYVLRSARVIAMMKIAREKLAATWIVVKGNRSTVAVDFQTLEMYRPLFKYLNGREMARLNLTDENILYFIGTHPNLNRHQVGVVASRYIRLNRLWDEPKYLNLMNNLICGVPMFYMRYIPANTYLQLSHQLFYHITACDPLQRRFYLAVMTRTQALGKSYSWSARDVSRLGLLLSELEGTDLNAIKPDAMAGITAQVIYEFAAINMASSKYMTGMESHKNHFLCVYPKFLVTLLLPFMVMLKIPATTLKYITDGQLRYLDHKSLNIFSRRLKIYEEQQKIFNGATFLDTHVTLLILWIIIII